jgi:predicted RNA-binding Zn ribbon-like protein
MAPAVAKRFRSGRPCLDFAHTAATAYWVEPELVHDRSSLEHWLAYILGLDEVRARAGEVAAADRLRAALLPLARARIEHRELPAAHVRTLNTFAAAGPPVPQMTAAGTLAPVVVTATAGLSAIARDAIDLFTGPLGHRIRACAAPDCALMFVDASRPGSRRWCSMQRCGNLSKLRAHRGSHPDPSTESSGLTPGLS